MSSIPFCLDNKDDGDEDVQEASLNRYQHLSITDQGRTALLSLFLIFNRLCVGQENIHFMINPEQFYANAAIKEAPGSSAISLQYSFESFERTVGAGPQNLHVWPYHSRAAGLWKEPHLALC